MSGFSLRYAHGNLLFGDGDDCAALYRLGVSSYPYLPAAGKWALQRRLQRLAHVIGADFSLWRVNRAFPAGEYVAHTGGLLDERHQSPQAWQAFLAGHEQRLRQLGSHTPEVYLTVSLSPRTTGIGSGVLTATDRVGRRVRELARRRTAPPLSARVLSEVSTREQRVFERVASVLAVARASTEELQWLLRRAASRGVAEPVLDRYWQPDALVIETSDGAGFVPLSSDLRQCAQAVFGERDRSLVVDGEQGRCWQAMLALGGLAEAPEFPGYTAEVLFAPLDALAWPVDAVLHARWVGNRQALAQVRKRIADVEHAYSEQLQGAAHGPSVMAGVDRVLARDYEAQLQAGGQPPMLYARVGLAVGADCEEELERRVAAVKEQYGDIAVHRPVGVQFGLWVEHLPGAGVWV